MIKALTERVGLGLIKTRKSPPAAAFKLGEAWHLRQLLAELGTDCVIDVGANRGQFARTLRSRVGYAGRIVSYEPTTLAFAALTQSRRGDAAWTGRPVALGTVAGVANMNVFERDVFSSFLPPSEFGASTFRELSEPPSTEQVSVVRLETDWPSVTAGCSSVFVKLDTQGRDLDVLASCGKVLDRVRGLLTEVPMQEIYEGMIPFSETIDRLRDLGFQVTGIWPETRDERMQVIEFNCSLRRA